MAYRICLVFAILLTTLTIASAQNGPTTHVAAAANLESVFTAKIIPAFEAKTSITVVPTFGATKSLAQQEENGAPFEVFVAADTTTVQKLASDGVLDSNSIKPYAVGTLVLWTSTTTGLKLIGINDVTNSAIQHIGIANPKTAPYGTAAIESLTAANLLATVTPKIVYAENIQQTLQYATTGNADVSFTALSLVINRTDGTYTVIPDKLHNPIVQSLGLVPNASTAAKQFADFLTSKDVDKIWKASGYRLPKR